VIDEHFDRLGEALRRSWFVALASTERVHTSPETAYWKARAALVDGSQLVVF